MAWEAEGPDEFQEWFASLNTEQQRQVVAAVEILQERGPVPGRPVVDTIKGSKYANMKELRVSKRGSLRILFMFDPSRQIILLTGGDKTGQWDSWYETVVPRAECGTRSRSRGRETEDPGRGR